MPSPSKEHQTIEKPRNVSDRHMSSWHTLASSMKGIQNSMPNVVALMAVLHANVAQHSRSKRVLMDVSRSE